jgi:hypothetical protein
LASRLSSSPSAARLLALSAIVLCSFVLGFGDPEFLMVGGVLLRDLKLADDAVEVRFPPTCQRMAPSASAGQGATVAPVGAFDANEAPPRVTVGVALRGHVWAAPTRRAVAVRTRGAQHAPRQPVRRFLLSPACGTVRGTVAWTVMTHVPGASQQWEKRRNQRSAFAVGFYRIRGNAELAPNVCISCSAAQQFQDLESLGDVSWGACGSGSKS